MPIQLTYNYFSGYMNPSVMKKTVYSSTVSKNHYDFYTYNFVVPFEPSQNPTYDGIVFHDAHGNTYNSADNIIAAKLDIGAFFSESGVITPINAALANSDIGATMLPSFYTLPTLQWNAYVLKNDPFDPFDYTPLLNGTDGYTPNDPLKLAGIKLMPFPVISTDISGDNIRLQAINTMVNTTPETPVDIYLLKLNEPLYIVSGSNATILNRIILYGKPFLNRTE